MKHRHALIALLCAGALLCAAPSIAQDASQPDPQVAKDMFDAAASQRESALNQVAQFAAALAKANREIDFQQKQIQAVVKERDDLRKQLEAVKAASNAAPAASATPVPAAPPVAPR